MNVFGINFLYKGNKKIKQIPQNTVVTTPTNDYKQRRFKNSMYIRLNNLIAFCQIKYVLYQIY